MSITHNNVKENVTKSCIFFLFVVIFISCRFFCWNMWDDVPETWVQSAQQLFKETLVRTYICFSKKTHCCCSTHGDFLEEDFFCCPSPRGRSLASLSCAPAPPNDLCRAWGFNLQTTQMHECGHMCEAILRCFSLQVLLLYTFYSCFGWFFDDFITKT